MKHSSDKFNLYADDDASNDEFDAFSVEADAYDRRARRKRKPKVHHVPKKDEQDIIESIADPIGLEGGFTTTYRLTQYEEEFLLDSVRPFYERDLITDILAQVKGGKEASVYRCQPHPSLGLDFVAVKVYRPRKFRHLRRDHIYRQGRDMKNIDGKPITERDKRMLKAVQQGSSIGQQVSHTSWLMYEYTTLEALYRAGADVPKPIANASNALLMGYVGDERQPAPTLQEIRLAPEERQPLLERILHNVGLLLQAGYVHGDLSAYNILYWQGDITLIDFPQVVDIHQNTQAYALFMRDIQRVCDYFNRQGLECDAESITQRLWGRYKRLDPYAHINFYEGANEDDEA